MAEHFDPRKGSTEPEPTPLAAAIGEYVDEMIGTGIDLDGAFEAAALETWAGLDDGNDLGDPDR